MPPTPASIAAALGIVVTAASLAGPARSSPPSGPPPPRFTAADSLRWRTFALEDEGIAPTQASADSLAKLLSDPDPAVRSRAILNLRRLASTFRRSGVVRVPREPQFPPLVEGLVPRLVAAATDTDSSVKKGALFALADTKDPEARKALRAHLADPDSGCRFTAACLLTEFGDDSGLEELGRALDRLAAPDEAPEPRHDFDAVCSSPRSPVSPG